MLIVMYAVLYAFYLLTVWCAEKLSWGMSLRFESISIVVYAILICKYTSPLICASLAVLSVLAVFTPGLYKKRLSERRKAYLDERAVYAKKTD